MADATTIPPGWNHNPSIWRQRLPIIVLALVGFAIVTYLGLFQMKVIGSVWEPFFTTAAAKS